MSAQVLILPGLYNSGAKHWQTVWEGLFPTLQRVNQADWETPVCDDWVARLEQAVQRTGSDGVLVAHSLACTLVGKWAERHPRTIRGALLVAPSDTEAPTYPPGTRGFTPMPRNRLPFPSLVVASTNDPYVSLERAQGFARHWGSEMVVAGALGHLNSDSGLGAWPQGLELLRKLTGDPKFTQ